MSERDDLMIKLKQILIEYGIPPDDLNAKLYLAIDPYEIQLRSTELVVADEETTEKYIKLEIMLSTWCRVSELAGIKISDFSEDRESVLIHGKGQKDRICYMNAKAKIVLVQYMSYRDDNNPYLFPSCKYTATEKQAFSSGTKKLKREELCNWWHYEEYIGDGHIDKSSIESKIRRLGKKAGVDNTHPHRFRRTGATFALRRGMPIEQVSKLLGHESIETTQIYLDISDRELEQSHKKYV